LRIDIGELMNSRLGENLHPLAEVENSPLPGGSALPAWNEYLKNVPVSIEQEYTFSYQQARIVQETKPETPSQ
jgi:hypothetical protein